MNTDALFKELEPPPGGAERFAQRLDEIAAERPPPRARVLALAAAVAAIALVTALLLLRPPSDAPELIATNTPPAIDVYNSPELDRLLGRSAQPTELMVTVDTRAANVTQLETTNQKVRIYQIN
jgi:hypothetical protein